MKIKTTIWIIGIAVILISIPTGILFWQNQSLKKQVAQYAGELNISYKALSKSLQRAETKVAKSNKELSIFAEQHKININSIKSDLKSLGGRLEAVAITEAKTNTVIHNHHPSDSNTSSKVKVPICKEDGRSIDLHGYTKRIENKKIYNSNGMRVADVYFSAAKKNPWSSKVYGIKYKILNTIGRGTKGQIILSTELIAENPEVQPNKTFRIEGYSSRILQAPEPGPSFKIWDPALYLAGQFGIGVWPNIEFNLPISLGFSLSSYGNWRFFGITAGLDGFQRTFFSSLIPFLYNIGDPLPFFSSIFIFPYIGIDHKSLVSIGIGIGTRL